MQFYATVTDETLREISTHGDEQYPLAYYVDDIQQFDSGHIDWHWHREVEFIMVSQGSVDCLVGKERILLPKGWGLFLNSETIHRFETENSGVMPNVVFAPEFIAAEKSLIYESYIAPILSSRVPYQVLNPNIGWQNSVLSIMNNLFYIQETANAMTPLNTFIITIELWKNLVDNMDITLATKKTNQNTLQSSYLHVMLQFIHDNYMKNVKLEHISKSANISKSSAIEIFRYGINQSPVSYLIEYRLMKSAILLKNTKKTVSDISYMTGFASSSYFCRKFKDKFNVSPKEYRKTISNDISLNYIYKNKGAKEGRKQLKAK